MSVYETYEQEQEYGSGEMETELAMELMELRNDQELEQFFGDIIKSVGSFIRGPVGRSIGGVLKDVAKTALPMVGGALGSMVAPGIGTAIGSQLGQFASGALGEVGYEQEQFETARKVIQLANAAAQQASSIPPNVPPQVAAQHAVARAAQQLGIHAGGNGQGEVGYQQHGEVGYQQGGDQQSGWAPPERGQWVRRGRRIVLYGVY